MMKSHAEPTTTIGLSQVPGVSKLKHYRFPLEFLNGMNLPDRPEWLIHGLMPARGLLVLYGRPGSGKSFLALDVALHIAAGRPWAGCPVKQAGVIYVAAEAGRGMRKRVLAALAHHGIPRTVPFALISVAPDLGHREGDATVLAEEIKAQLPAGFVPGLVVLDTLARSMVGADESGSAGMGTFVQNAEALGEALQALVMPIHHTGKDLDRGMRGSSALLGAADAVWIVDDEKGRCLRVEKMKEEADDLAVPFTLERVVVGTDADQWPITTCVVRHGGPEPAAADQAQAPVCDGRAHEVEPWRSRPLSLSPGCAVFAEALRVLLARHGGPVTRYRHIPKGVPVLRQSDLRRYPELAPAAGSVKSRQSSIDRFIRELEAAGLLARHGGYVWLCEDLAFTTSAEKQAA